MLIAPKSELEILNSLKLPWDSQGNGRFTTDLQGRLWMSNSDPRTGTFPQMRPTVGDTACNVKGVQGTKIYHPPRAVFDQYRGINGA